MATRRRQVRRRVATQSITTDMHVPARPEARRQAARSDRDQATTRRRPVERAPFT